MSLTVSKMRGLLMVLDSDAVPLRAVISKGIHGVFTYAVCKLDPNRVMTRFRSNYGAWSDRMFHAFVIGSAIDKLRILF
jgi:hypothetical protein